MTDDRSEAQGLGGASSEEAHQLVIEIVRRFTDALGYAFVVHLTASIDVLFQPLVDVFVASSLVDLRFVVKLDLGNQKPREASRLVMLLGVLGLRLTKSCAAFQSGRRDVLSARFLGNIRSNGRSRWRGRGWRRSRLWCGLRRHCECRNRCRGEAVRPARGGSGLRIHL